jgi:hypothetical protein
VALLPNRERNLFIVGASKVKLVAFIGWTGIGVRGEA